MNGINGIEWVRYVYGAEIVWWLPYGRRTPRQCILMSIPTDIVGWSMSGLRWVYPIGGDDVQLVEDKRLYSTRQAAIEAAA